MLGAGNKGKNRLPEGKGNKKNEQEPVRPGRTVCFPMDRAVGKLFLREWGSHQNEDWKRTVEARGTVTIPAGKEVMLDMSKEGANDLSFLGTLRHDDIQSLRFFDVPVSDVGLAHVQGLTGLQSLDLYGGKISDAGLGHLHGLAALQILDLTDTRVSDAGLAHVKDLTALRELYLTGTQVSETGLGHLTKLSTLQVLYLGNVQASEAVLEKLRRGCLTE